MARKRTFSEAETRADGRKSDDDRPNKLRRTLEMMTLCNASQSSKSTGRSEDASEASPTSSGDVSMASPTGSGDVSMASPTGSSGDELDEEVDDDADDDDADDDDADDGEVNKEVRAEATLIVETDELRCTPPYLIIGCYHPSERRRDGAPNIPPGKANDVLIDVVLSRSALKTNLRPLYELIAACGLERVRTFSCVPTFRFSLRADDGLRDFPAFSRHVHSLPDEFWSIFAWSWPDYFAPHTDPWYCGITVRETESGIEIARIWTSHAFGPAIHLHQPYRLEMDDRRYTSGHFQVAGTAKPRDVPTLAWDVRESCLSRRSHDPGPQTVETAALSDVHTSDDAVPAPGRDESDGRDGVVTHPAWEFSDDEKYWTSPGGRHEFRDFDEESYFDHGLDWHSDADERAFIPSLTEHRLPRFLHAVADRAVELDGDSGSESDDGLCGTEADDFQWDIDKLDLDVANPASSAASIGVLIDHICSVKEHHPRPPDLSVAYPALDPRAREGIWREHTAASPSRTADGVLTGEDFAALAWLTLTSREIENVAKAARLYAGWKAEPLCIGHVARALRVRDRELPAVDADNKRTAQAADDLNPDPDPDATPQGGAATW